MDKSTIVRIAVASALFTSAPAWAQMQSAAASSGCSLRIDTGSTNWIIPGYDPFAANVPIATFDVTFDNQGGTACAFNPVFVVDQEPFGLTSSGREVRVSYTLLDQFANASVTPLSGRTVARATRRPVVVQARSQQLVRFQFAVDEDALRADGLYRQNVMLVAEEQRRGDVLASRALVLGVNVLPSAVLGLSGQYKRNGGQVLVDLGELTPGVAQVPLQVRVASTRAYRLEIASKNGGLLKMANAHWSIPYQIGVGDQTLSLSSMASYESSGTRPASDSLPLQFVIGETAGKRAGVYTDLLTVSIAPK